MNHSMTFLLMGLAVLTVAAGTAGGCSTLADDCRDARCWGGGSSAGGSAGGGATGGGGSATGAGSCTLGTEVGCAPGDKCTFVDLATLEIGCVEAGSGGPATLCADERDCAVGHVCDPATQVCEEICNEPGAVSTCYPGWCLDLSYPGHGLCTVGCEPIGTNGCPDGLTCGWWTLHDGDQATFHCAVPADGGNLAEGDPCVIYPFTLVTNTCAPGLACVGVEPEGSCLRWCAPTGQQSQCAPGQICQAFPSPIIQNGTEYGACM